VADVGGVSTLYIQPGSPWENAYAESFNSRFEVEFLSREIFSRLPEAQVLAEEYGLKYNHVRPHSARLPNAGGVRHRLGGDERGLRACGAPAFDHSQARG
jgi:hypothetical protein